MLKERALGHNKHELVMRTTKTISISMPPAQLRQAERLARKQNRTMSEFIREALRRYAEEAERREKLGEFRLALESLRQEAAASGANRLSAKQIDAEVQAARNSVR